MYNPQELQRKAQLNLHGVDNNAQTNLSNNVTATSEEKEQGWLTRGLATIGNVVSNILEGAIKSMEGGIDATAMLVGLFGADVDDFVSYDFTSDIFGTDEENEGLLDWTWGKNLEATSYWDNDTMVNQVAEGVGGMLPSIALSAIPYVGGVLSTVSFIASAQGKSSESALRQGADYDEALIYGGLSGAIEGGIEKISSGIGGFAGKNAGKIFGKQIGKTALGKAAVSFVGEGLEEVASDIIDPQLQRWTGVNENAKVDTNNLFRTFIVGGSVGAVLNGAGRRLSAISNSNIGGEKFLRIADQVSFIESDINIKESFLSSGKKTQADISKISVKTADDISKRLDNISYNLKLMDETQRLSALAVINQDNSIISNLFDEYGNVKAGVKEQLELSKNRNFSANAILKSQAINEELQKLNEEKGVSVEIDDTPINENERKNLAKFFATKEGLSEKSGENLNFVVVKGKGAEELNGFYSPATKSIYITKDAVNNSLYQTSTHEIKHFVRDGLLEKYLVNSTQNDGAEGKVFKKIVDEIINKKEYGINKQDIDSAIYKKSDGAKLTETEQLAYDELTAHLAEEILGNEEFINRLARSNKGLFNKIRNFISDKVNSKNQSEQYKTAQSLFDKALKEIKDSERIDNGEEIKYARKETEDYQKYFNPKIKNLLSGKEWKFWYDERTAYLKGAKFVKIDSDILIPVGQNKIVVTDVEFGNPYAKEVVILTNDYDGNSFDLVKYIEKEAIKYDYSIQEIWKLAKNVYGETLFNVYNGTVGVDSESIEERESSNRQNDRVLQGDRFGESADRKSTKSNDIKFSLKDSVEEDVVKRYGKTYNWAETGYILTDGTRLDLSGRRDGAMGGRRTIDHRDIFDIYEDVDGSDAMIEFMSRGNIRVSPEYPGINIQVEPNAEQYRLIQDLVERLGWREEYFSVDIDNKYGDVVETLSYEGKVSGRKVVSDIKYYFKEGKVPYQSELSKFRFSRKITADMTDSERYEILKDKSAKAPVYDGSSNEIIDKETSNLKNGQKELIEATMRRLAVEFGLFKGNKVEKYNVEDFDIAVTLSKRTLDESSHKIITNVKQLAKLLPVLKQVAEGAIGIESHINRYFFDNTTREFYELVGGYIEGEYFIPVRLGVKAFVDNTYGLYVVVCQDKIKKTKVIASKGLDKSNAPDARLVNINLTQLFKNVNTIDMLRYIPDDFLTISQRELKYQGISETIKYANDKNDEKYREYISKHDYASAKRMVVVSAKANGYTIEAYHGSRNTFNVFDENKKGINTKTQTSKDWFFASDIKTANSYYPYGIMKELEKRYPYNKMFNAETLKEKGKLYHLFLKMKNPLVVDVKDYDYASHRTDKSAWMEFVEEANKNGNDGIILYNAMDNQLNTSARESIVYMFRNSSQAKSADVIVYDDNGDIIPLSQRFNDKVEDIRFSRKQSDGEVTKKLANYTRKKVYSKVEAERLVNTILATNLNFEDYNVEISGKTKAEAVEELWKNFNTLDAGKRTGAANKIADYIIDNAVMESYFAEAENDYYTETIDTLRPFLHSIDLSHIREEIKYRGDNSAYLLWGKKKGESGMTADQVAQKLGEQGVRINAETEADIFFEIDEMYRKAVKELKVKTEEQLKDYLSEEDRKQLRGDIAKAILRGYEENGKKSRFTEIVEEQSKNARKWKELYYEEKGRNSAEEKLLYQVQKIRDIHFGDFQNASQADNKLFRGSIEKLSAIKNRGDLNRSGTRRIIAGLNSWYKEDNPLLSGRYSQEISTALNQIASGEGNLTTAEIRNLTDVVAYFRHFIETANKIYRAGKYIDAMPIAEDYVRKLHDNEKIQLGTVGRVFDKTFNNSRANYMETFNDPMTVVRYMDKYDNGFFTQTMEEFRDCAVNAAVLEMDLNANLEAFYKKNKKFLKEARRRMVNYNGVEIPAIDAFNVYMALNREEGMLKLAWSGFKWVDKKGKTTSVDGFVTDMDMSADAVQFLANEVQYSLEKQFTETDLEYIKIAEDLFNNRCKKLKEERDLSRYGYSNVSENYYIPIVVANVAKSIDVDGWQSEVDRVSNLSFNKATVKGAKNEMLIEPLNVVLTRHLRGIAQYYHLSNAVDNYDIIYNMDTGGNKNKVISVKSESKNVWQHGEEYMKEMLSDIQGIKKGKSSKMFGFVRSNYAKYQLGANPKVWFTQLSSLFASTSILDFSSVVKGLGVSADDVDVYCRLAELRNSDDTAARAQGNLSDTQGDGVVSKVSDMLMKPIGAMDRFVIKKLFGACQVQVQKDTGLKIGTEENKVKAGELLKKVILETQQNAIATERSMAMRSTSELMRTLTMFTSDSMKVIGRVIDAYGEITMLKARKRITTDKAELARLDAELKRANKKALKATASLVTQAVFMALIAQAFKTLYNKDDEEENIVENMTVDAIGNLFGGLPLFKDVYAKLVEGYDFDGYQYSALNDLLDSTSDMLDLVGAIFNGSADSRDFAQNIRKLSYAIGQLFGIPVRNVYNVVFGLVNRVSPETGYKWNDKFYKQSYSKDLKRAIKNEDEEMIATIAGLMIDENVGAFGNSSTRKEISRLVGADFDVLPSSVPSSVTVGEEQITLTSAQKKAYKEVYSQSITAIDKLVSTNGYKVASDDAKAKAIKYVYRYYYYEAQQKSLNIELDSKLYLFGQVIPIDKMALILAEVPTIADKSTNKKQAVQKYLQGAKLTAIQKYMLMGYFGYKNTNGKSAVESTINKTSLTKEQKKLLLEKCGY